MRAIVWRPEIVNQCDEGGLSIWMPSPAAGPSPAAKRRRIADGERAAWRDRHAFGAPSRNVWLASSILGSSPQAAFRCRFAAMGFLTAANRVPTLRCGSPTRRSSTMIRYSALAFPILLIMGCTAVSEKNAFQLR